MNFVRGTEINADTEWILNAAHIVSVFESFDDKQVCVNLVGTDDTLYFDKQAWNKAVREAGVPGLQFF